MTPTLNGRWQTRVLLMVGLGGPITAIYALATSKTMVPFYLLGYALAFGLVWDVLYSYLQTLRWDRDWPLPGRGPAVRGTTRENRPTQQPPNERGDRPRPDGEGRERPRPGSGRQGQPQPPSRPGSS